MKKCPLYKKCTFTDTLTGSDGYSYRHCTCEGKGTQSNGWKDCPVYDPAKVPVSSGGREYGVALLLLAGVMILFLLPIMKEGDSIQVGLTLICIGVLIFFGVLIFLRNMKNDELSGSSDNSQNSEKGNG